VESRLILKEFELQETELVDSLSAVVKEHHELEAQVLYRVLSASGFELMLVCRFSQVNISQMRNRPAIASHDKEL